MTCERCGNVYIDRPDNHENGLCDDCEAADAQAFEDWRHQLHFGPFDDTYQYNVWRGWQWTPGKVG